MKKLFLLLSLVFLAGSVAGEVHYQIEADSDSVQLNTTVRMSCDTSTCPGLRWGTVPGSEILAVRDGDGEIDYTYTGGEIDIPGERKVSREFRVIEIQSRLERDAEEIHAGLFKRTLQLSGFPDEETSGTISAENLLSGRTGFGFRESFQNDSMKFRGEGPVNLRIKFGDGHETRYFSFFGYQPGETEMAYEIPVGTLGTFQEFKRFPVAVMNDETYDRKVNRWSAGEYVSGAIQIRNPDEIGEDFLPVLAHEVVHGINDRILTWDQTSSSYFDEGTGKYVEFLVKKKTGGSSRTRELFGEEVSWTERKNGSIYRYTLPPKGDKEQLWNYYQNDRDFMKTWNAMDADTETRKFGYAYSELIIRNHIARQNGSLKNILDSLDVERKVSDPEVKWSIYSDLVEMEPCNYESRERFEQCLEEINSYDYPVYSAAPRRSGSQLNIERLEVPERNQSRDGLKIERGRNFFRGFINYISSLLRSLLEPDRRL